MIPARGKAKAKAKEPEPEPEVDEEEEEEDPDEYAVEKILAHDYNKKGELIFQIKWLGYEDEADLTWEPEENLEDAQDILKAYFKKIGGKPEPLPKSTSKSKKGGRASTGKRTAADAFADSPAPAGKSKKGRKSNGVAGEAESGSGTLKLPVGDWEDHVLRVTSIIEETDLKAKRSQKELIGLLEWNNGKKTQHKMKVLRQKVPQKLLDYYEQHLVFTQAGGADDVLDGVAKMATAAEAATEDADPPAEEEEEEELHAGGESTSTMDSKGKRWHEVVVCFTDGEVRFTDVLVCVYYGSSNEQWAGDFCQDSPGLANDCASWLAHPGRTSKHGKVHLVGTCMMSIIIMGHDTADDETLDTETLTNQLNAARRQRRQLRAVRSTPHDSFCRMRRDKRRISKVRWFCLSQSPNQAPSSQVIFAPHSCLLLWASCCVVLLCCVVPDSPANPAKPISLTHHRRPTPRTEGREREREERDWMSDRRDGSPPPRRAHAHVLLEETGTGSDAPGMSRGPLDAERDKASKAFRSTYERRDDDGGKRELEVNACGDDDEAATAQHLLAHATLALDADPTAAETNTDPAHMHPDKAKPQPVTWSSLPKKSQLAILTLARLSEPLTQTSLQAYMFYQLKSFHRPGDPPPSDATVAQQAGLLAAAFTGAQFLTAMLWGRLADSDMFGRKRVILIGLLGTMIGSLGFGFSGSFAVAVFWRVVGGMLNGNIGVMRTMISEMVQDKKYLSRAFLLLPMCFNIGVIVGPLLGGLLADPAGSHPEVFGEVAWLKRWPYALPNVVMAVFLAGSAAGVVFGLDETLEGLRDRPDWGRRVAKWVVRVMTKGGRQQEYAALPDDERVSEDVELGGASLAKKNPSTPKRRLPFRRLWTPNLLLTLLAHGLLAMHVGTFSNLWFVYLSTPRYTPTSPDHPTPLHLPAHYRPHGPFIFTGGLALPPPSIGTALAILGAIGIILQLLLYPRVSFALGTQTSFRLSLCLFPLAYTLAPYLSIIPSTTAAPGPATGPSVWAALATVLAIQVLARTFALPSTAILVNNACPHPSVLGTVHGIAQSVSSATRTLGPVLAGWLYGVGLGVGVVGLAWWCMAVVAVAGAVAGQWVREGSGREIWLDGEEQEEEVVKE
ncbi:putative membrane protein [Teratosphaeria destructans]|uniref:Membrane protein n=1 Tax=Teratosphaeria destructans TaxID=418781 RepID=A0A9W7STS0_9PEZI|nr:putative membrane protein [Teratosphaeria destructans]